MSTLVKSPDSDGNGYVEILVAQALDDHEEGRLAPEVLLRTIARAAWEGGRRFERSRSVPSVDTTEMQSRR